LLMEFTPTNTVKGAETVRNSFRMEKENVDDQDLFAAACSAQNTTIEKIKTLSNTVHQDVTNAVDATRNWLVKHHPSYFSSFPKVLSELSGTLQDLYSAKERFEIKLPKYLATTPLDDCNQASKDIELQIDRVKKWFGDEAIKVKREHPYELSKDLRKAIEVFEIWYEAQKMTNELIRILETMPEVSLLNERIQVILKISGLIIQTVINADTMSRKATGISPRPVVASSSYSNHPSYLTVL
jgi:hypothetical protein